MARVFKVLALLLVLALVGFSLLAWWNLRFDVIDEPNLPGKIEAGVIDHDGKQRTWFAYLPKSMGTHPPVVILMHGSQGSGKDMRGMSFYSFDVQAERAGYIAVYPDGFEGHWNDCRASAAYSANQQNIDDVGFLRDLVAQLQQRYGADPRQIYAAGFSNGGQMAFRLGMEAPDLVAGVASISASLPAPENLGCEASGQPLPVMVINGTEDPVNPFDGGVVSILGDDSRGPVLSTEKTARYWSDLGGHSGSYKLARWPDKDPEDHTTVETLRWELPGKPDVEVIKVIGGGHAMPNPTFNLPRLLGPTSHEFDTAEVIWDFFSAQPPR